MITRWTDFIGLDNTGQFVNYFLSEVKCNEVVHFSDRPDNRPFPNCLQSHFQSEAWCTTFHMKMSFICMLHDAPEI